VNKKRKCLPYCSVSEAYDRFKKDNPLLMRKKFQMKDVFFRRNEPDRELLRWELAFDLEWYVLLIALRAVGVCVLCKIACLVKRGRIRRMDKHLMRGMN